MGTGYTRQSAADIIDGEDIVAEPLTREFNAIRDAFDGMAGHTHDGTTGEGPLINLQTSIEGVLPVANGGFGGIHKLNATANPTVNDDVLDGYAVGSTWVNLTTDKAFLCVDSTAGAAVWIGEQVLDGDLSVIGALTGTGFLVRTGTTTWALRTITVTAPITITNGDGIAGNVALAISAATTTDPGTMSAADKTKLDGIATAATANSTDATLLARANHTGVQAISTITDLQTTLDDKLESADIAPLVGPALVAATEKTTPVNNDMVTILDSADSYAVKKTTWTNIKAFLKTYFDTLYAAATHSHSDATTSVSGYMSSTDKTKMDALGTNGYGTRTISTSAPSGGTNGDIWLQV